MYNPFIRRATEVKSEVNIHLQELGILVNNI